MNVLKNDKLNYKGRLRALKWSVLPVLCLCYLLGYKKTIGVIQEYGHNKELQRSAALAADSIKLFRAKQQTVSNWKKQYLVDSTSRDGMVLASINNHCDSLGLQFKEYKPMGVSGQRIWTRMVSVEGEFRDLLQLVFLMEQRDRLCRIASVKYQQQREEDGGALRCSIYIQNIVDSK
jgi:hypothetical protein